MDRAAAQSFRDAVGHRGGPSGLVRGPRGRSFLARPYSYFSPAALILALSLLALVPMAGASIPDPIWSEGMYDGADRDDAVGMAPSLAGVVELCLIAERSLTVLADRLPAESSDVVTAWFTARRGRSPPHPLALVS